MLTLLVPVSFMSLENLALGTFEAAIWRNETMQYWPWPWPLQYRQGILINEWTATHSNLWPSLPKNALSIRGCLLRRFPVSSRWCFQAKWIWKHPKLHPLKLMHASANHIHLKSKQLQFLHGGCERFQTLHQYSASKTFLASTYFSVYNCGRQFIKGVPCRIEVRSPTWASIVTRRLEISAVCRAPGTFTWQRITLK